MRIGVFDSGYGGLTILNKISQHLPQYDYLYLGDNARTPYGTRSFEVIYEYTLEAVRYLQSQGCRLIILACNTASAKALRTIQQHDIDPSRVRVLGVIRPTVEAVPGITRNGHIGILATPGTVSSESYVLELEKIFHSPNLKTSFNFQLSTFNLSITQQSCPLWVPLIEAGEHTAAGADYFVEKYIRAILDKDPQIDTLILGCTHYPLIQQKIEAALQGLGRQDIRLVAQGEIVAQALDDYLKRHSEIAHDLSLGGQIEFLTTESADKFNQSASLFLSAPICAKKVIF
ncbi:MAG: glutamate racemase [Paludibacteraceae bacterium]|nr:glutamate racemase [Paludibacteraceae bacterium]